MIINEVFIPIKYVHIYVNTDDLFPSNTSNNNDDIYYSTRDIPNLISEISRQTHNTLFTIIVLYNEKQSNQTTTYNGNNNIPIYILFNL